MVGRLFVRSFSATWKGWLWAVLAVAPLLLTGVLAPAGPAHAETRTVAAGQSCGTTPEDWSADVLLGSGSGAFHGEIATAHTDHFYEAHLTLAQLLGSRTATLTLTPRERSGGPVTGPPLTYEGSWEIPFLSTEVRVEQMYPAGQFLLKLGKPSCNGENSAKVTSGRLLELHTPDDGQFIPSGSSWTRENP